MRTCRGACADKVWQAEGKLRQPRLTAALHGADAERWARYQYGAADLP